MVFLSSNSIDHNNKFFISFALTSSVIFAINFIFYSCMLMFRFERFDNSILSFNYSITDNYNNQNGQYLESV